ncbi:MAG TPA: nuclear transport factor 2 family protein [Terriglobales bacterium]|nr:nuclear transport factor 2 family protein [Terriglobales bacterium]
MKSHRVAFVACICAGIVVANGFAEQMSRAKSPDKAYCQKIWDGWSTLDPSNVAKLYASGTHTFFDIAPLRYASWGEYEKGVRQELADYKSAKFTMNDDAMLHPAGSYVWGTATVKYEMTHKNGKVDSGDMRWTVVFEKQDGRWLIVHEHVSVPMQ